MDILENAGRHYRTAREVQGPVLVPEWGDTPEKPAKIYYKIYDEKARKAVRAIVIECNDADRPVAWDVLQFRALNEDGSKMFKKAELAVMRRNMEHSVVERVCESMARGSELAITKARPYEVEENPITGDSAGEHIKDEDIPSITEDPTDNYTDEDLKN